MLQGEENAAVLPRRVPLQRGDGTPVLDAVLQHADELLERRILATWLPVLLEENTRDARWEWERLTRDTRYTTGVEYVMITLGDEVEGILITSVPNARPPRSTLESLVYVEYVATAPWNRKTLVDEPKLRKVGPTLIKYAVHRSRAVGRGGRIGLCSEPDAISYYDENLRLKRCGEDPEEEPDDEGKKYEYFEGDAPWADAFLSRR